MRETAIRTLRSNSRASGNQETSYVSHASREASLAAANARKTRIVRCALVVLVALILRWSVSYHPYSGAAKPPMYGDYEAQRHWQEITLNLPATEWYSNSSANNLQYWGLDYPPLTAYHSYLLGRIANAIYPDSVRLHRSRGYESQTHKYLMRLSVLAADLLVFIPAAICFTYLVLPILESKPKRQSEKNDRDVLSLRKRDMVLATMLFYPGLILIDYGHFQYNCVSLGFFVISAALLAQGSMTVGSFFFVLALNYKQMELYHALPCFFYILGINMPGKRRNLLASAKTLGLVIFTVIVTFGIIWAPFLRDRRIFLEVLGRLFPLSRGIFEDKVANFWCAFNVIYKLRQTFDNFQLAQICLISTALVLLPSGLDLFFRPSREKFLLALINSSLAFFLFSYQVHEKSILLVALPVLMHFHKDPFPCFWFLIVSSFSMLPLIVKDGLYLAYFALSVFYLVAVTWMWFEPKVNNLIRVSGRFEKERIEKSTPRKPKTKKPVLATTVNNIELYVNILFVASMVILLVLTLCSGFVKPPTNYPDLFPLLVSVCSCIHFLAFLGYFNYQQIYVTPMPARKLKLK